MRRVIESENYVWIVTANKEYNYTTFSRAYFGESNSGIYKSPFFKFMNPKIMESVYVDAKKLKPLDPSLGDITVWSDKTIHHDGLKPYAMYAQSLLYKNGDFFKDKKFSIVKMYLFDDISEKEIKDNSKKFGIDLFHVKDFASPPVANLLKDFTKVLNDGPSKIGSAEKPVIPIEYDDKVIALLMADNTDLPKCKPDKYIDKPDFVKPPTPEKNNMIGNVIDNKIGNSLQVCVNGNVATNQKFTNFSTDTDITKWTTSSDDIFSDHAPVKYKYVITEKSSDVICNNCSTADNQEDSTNTSFITWNIAYQMTHTGKFYLSKFYCSETDIKKCVEEDEIYRKRMQNILTAIRSIMEYNYNANTNYVFLQECTPTLLNVVKEVPTFNNDFEILTKGESEFCLVVRKSAIPKPGDVIVFDFGENKGGSAMSEYISSQINTYDIEVNTSDLERVMCYIVKPASTIFFNVHFRLGKSFIFQRQIELYNFMNAIVYSIRSIPIDDANLGTYQNYDIVFTGDFNLNMLQRFPQDIKRFGYQDNNMIPIFFTCNYIPGQRTIISTTYDNLSTARATNGLDSNYNLTNIDFSILYPRIGDNGTKPIKVELDSKKTPIMPIKKTLPIGSGEPVSSSSPPSSSSTSTSADTLKVMSFNTWFAAFEPKTRPNGGDDTLYCNVDKDGKITNECEKNIMAEIMDKTDKKYEVIFLQEVVNDIPKVFAKYKPSIAFNPTPIKNYSIMTYTSDTTPSESVEYYVYNYKAMSEFITTLCSKKFFKNPADKYFMGNLVGYPFDQIVSHTSGAKTPVWSITGGARPYIVLVFDNEKIILINIHGPHPSNFNPYKQTINFTDLTGKSAYFPIGVEDASGSLQHNKVKYKINPVFGASPDPATQKKIDDKLKEVKELNKRCNNNLQEYAFTGLGKMLKEKIPTELSEYNIIFGGDFNENPNTIQKYLAQLGSEFFFSKDSKNFLPDANNLLSQRSTPTCCITKPGNSFKSIYDQIYSNKLNIKNYDTYNETKLKRTPDKGSVYFSDHLPVYAEIELPAFLAPPSPSPPPPPSPPEDIPAKLSYITKSNELLTADPSVPNCACGHMICKRFQILKTKNLIANTGGVHAVMIFESANDKDPDNPSKRKFRILLGKEQKTERNETNKTDTYTYYCMNTIGGTADHETGDSNCDVCIIQNLIDEINEEAKLKFPSFPLIIPKPSEGNMTEEEFNQIFKKPNAKGTDYTDYYLYARGGDSLSEGSVKQYTISFIFYGLYPYIFNESNLCKLITDTNTYIQSIVDDAKIATPALKEIKYLNLIDYAYNVLDDNPGYKTQVIFTNPEKLRFSAPDEQYYLIPPSVFSKDAYRNQFNNTGSAKKDLFISETLTSPADYISFFARDNIYSSEFPDVKKTIDEVVANAKSISPSSRPVLNYDSNSYSFGKATAYLCCDSIGSSMAGGNNNTNKRFTLRNNNSNNNINKSTSRKIRKSTSTSMPTTRFTKKRHNHNKKHKTRRHKH